MDQLTDHISTLLRRAPAGTQGPSLFYGRKKTGAVLLNEKKDIGPVSGRMELYLSR